MGRVPCRRQWTEAACYQAMNRGHNRETVFRDRANFRHFLGLLGPIPPSPLQGVETGGLFG